MDDTKVPEQFSVESIADGIRRIKILGGHPELYAIGFIEAIAQDLHTPDAVKVRQIRDTLIAAQRVRTESDAADATGLAYSRADDGEPSGPAAGRVPSHHEDGRTGEVVEVEPGYIPQFGEPGYPGCPGCGKTNTQHAPGCREDA